MTLDTLLLPLQSSAGDAVAGLVVLLVALAIFVAVVGGTWLTFSKAGEPGWAAIVPIYNVYVMLKIGGNEWWWLLLLFVPIVNRLGVKPRGLSVDSRSNPIGQACSRRSCSTSLT